MEQGVVPEYFRKANVTPIFKNGDRSEAGNYRSISLTSIVGKLMESIIRDHIVEHLETYNLMNDSQHGFRCRRSCLTNLLEFYKIIENVDPFKTLDII